MRLVTSFGDAGYDVYGEKFLKSYKQHCDLPLTVYYEIKRSFPKANRIEYRDMYEVPNLQEYLSIQGLKENMGHGEDWRFNIFKFCRKAFIQFDELKMGGKFAWMDADVEFKTKADEAFIKNTVKDTYIAYLGREGFHCCTSFVGFNTDHEDHPRFLKAFEDIYLSGGVFKLQEWHDAYVFQHLLNETGVKAKNLCQNIRMAAGSRNVFDMVFKFGRHKKGNRKFSWCVKE